MAKIILTSLALAALLWGCAKPPRDELQAARMAVARAYDSGAADLAATEYQAAGEALSEGERFARQGNYQMAREVLPFAEALAHRAILKAREEQSIRELQQIRAQQQSEGAVQQERKRPPTQPTKKAIGTPLPLPGSKPATVPPPPPPSLTHYVVSEGDVLWSIAARKEVYADPLLWPILYRANRDQIKDPRHIYPGQSLSIPRGVSSAELEEARESARHSEIFPVELILRNTRKNSR
jgi:nucleoid-associated protein YgaU